MNATTTAEAMTLETLEPQQAHLPAVQQGGAVVGPGSDSTVQLLATAVQRGASIEELRELMQLRREIGEDQERERKRDAELTFRRDFAAFRGENVIIPKSKFVERGRAGSFSQAEFEGVCRLLSPALSKHGFGFRHGMRFGLRPWPTPEAPDNQIGWVWVTCYLEHRDGHAETLELEGPPDEQSANTPVQNMQSTASFLKRQSLLAITGTATGGEDDENQMKSKRVTGAGAGDEAAPSASMLDAGRAAAKLGTDKLTAWWSGLDNTQRSQMNAEFGAMRKTARQADQEAGHA